MRTFGTIVIGAGPAGVGPLVAAHQLDRLDRTLDTGLLYVDPGDTFGAGSIGRYAIASDTSADTLLESLNAGDSRVLDAVRRHPVVDRVKQYLGDAVPLTLAGEYLGTLGEAIRAVLDANPHSDFYPRSRVTAVRRAADGRWVATVDRADGASEQAAADRVVIACGGVQRRERMLAAGVGVGYTLADAGVADKLMTSDELLLGPGPAAAAARLANSERPRVTVVGASHSAMCCAWALLNLSGVPFGEGGITLLHGHPFPVFYPTREAALADGYTAFTDDDFCPITGRLFRLAGLRMKTRALAMRVLGIGNHGPEPRVRLQHLDRRKPADAAVRGAIENADLVVTALGYRPNNPPLFDAAGQRIALLSDDPAAANPMVDLQCRVLDAAGRVVPGVYGTGLASGFKYNGELGGEPSFVGQANSLWLYQNGIGEILRRWMTTPAARAAA